MIGLCPAREKGKTMSELHAYNNDADTVIAHSPDDAVKVWEETTGETYDESYSEFTQISDNLEYTLYEEEAINPDPIPEGAVLVARGEYSYTYRAPVSAWIKARGRCFLGSTEY